MQTDVNEENIRVLVTQFYTKIRGDKDLGPIFTNKIGETDEEWTPHLNTMCDFWSSVMLKSGRYHSTPMQKHQALPPFDKSLFDNWLLLFFKTVDEIYSPEISEIYKEKSFRIAQSLKMGIFDRREFPVYSMRK